MGDLLDAQAVRERGLLLLAAPEHRDGSGSRAFDKRLHVSLAFFERLGFLLLEQCICLPIREDALLLMCWLCRRHREDTQEQRDDA